MVLHAQVPLPRPPPILEGYNRCAQGVLNCVGQSRLFQQVSLLEHCCFCAGPGDKSKERGLISADRKTSLLSCLQYPFLIKSSTMDLRPDGVVVAIACDAGPCGLSLLS